MLTSSFQAHSVHTDNAQAERTHEAEYSFPLMQQWLERRQDEPSVNLRLVTMSLGPSVSMDTEGLKVVAQVKEACSEQNAQSIVPWL